MFHLFRMFRPPEAGRENDASANGRCIRPALGLRKTCRTRSSFLSGTLHSPEHLEHPEHNKHDNQTPPTFEPTLRIGTWNVEHASAAKNAQRLAVIERADADIWVLTETQDGFDLG